MDREKIEELISAHLDGELEASETEELETLLKESEEARALLESYQNQGRGLAGLPDLKAPTKLKAITREKLKQASKEDAVSDSLPQPIKKRSSPVWVWIASSAAACLLFLFAAEKMDPGTQIRFYLTTNGIYHQDGSRTETFPLLPAEGNIVSLLTPKFEAKFTSGTARVSWSADAGTLPGTAMRARLSLDFDGDEVYDFVEESVRLELDSKEGFQKLAASFPLEGIWDEHGQGHAKVELFCDDETIDGVSVKFHPGHSHLVLPLAKFKPV